MTEEFKQMKIQEIKKNISLPSEQPKLKQNKSYFAALT